VRFSFFGPHLKNSSARAASTHVHQIINLKLKDSMLKTQIFLNIPIDSLFSFTKFYSLKIKKKKKIVKIFNIATKAKERKRRICPLNFVLPSSTSLATMNPHPPVHQ